MSDFFRFAEAHGVLIKSLIPSGKIVRCATVLHPRSTNGAYMWDGQRGFVFAWDGPAEPQWFNDPSAKPWTEAEKREFAQKRNLERQQLMQRQQRTAQNADAMVRAAVLGEHNYFHFKGLPDARGLIQADGSLLVPMRSLTGALQGAQVIRWDHENRRYDKRMLPSMKAKGAVLRIGPPRASQTFLCEGYATGLSIELAVRQMRLSAAVLVCFSATNMVHVAPLVVGPKFVFADNDESGTGERVALETGLPYCMSDRVGEDANDLHVRAGLLPVCNKLMNVRREAMA
jgi:putative DNA primase/helicase